MAELNQTEKGKSFEYAILRAVQAIVKIPVKQNSAASIAELAYNKLLAAKQMELDQAAKLAITFLYHNDINLKKADTVFLQDDKTGIQGDVRDLVIITPKKAIGISAKHNHKAVKHSRAFC